MPAKITIKEVAKKTNLSIATVSRAINPQTRHLVAKQTLKTIDSVIEKVHFTPSLPARRLVTGKSYNIVIFFQPEPSSSFYNDYYSKMIDGAVAALQSTSYNLILAVIGVVKGGFDIPTAISKMDVAAAIVCNFAGITKLSARNIFNVDIPMVVINAYPKEQNPTCFLIDNFMGAYDATTYLINKGHRNIAFIRGERGAKDPEDRFQGFRKALRDNYIRYDEKLCYQGDDLNEGAGEKAADYLFKDKTKAPSAVFCSSDLSAIGLLNKLNRMGINCPKDVSIIGFDGIDHGKYTTPPLTTMRQPIFEMSNEATKELINNLEHDKKFRGTRFFKAGLIERESVAPFS